MKASKFKKKYAQLEKLFSHDERFQLYAEHELAQLDYESSMNNCFKKGLEDGLEEGRKKGALDERQATVMRMLQNNVPLPFITIASALSEQDIRDIAQKNGISIA